MDEPIDNIEKAKTEVDNNSDENDTLISIEEQRASYGTIDQVKDSKRFWFRMPDGKLVYAHHASLPDSYMHPKDSEHGGILAVLGNRGNGLENYFRAIDYIEQNIDFPPDSEDDPVEMYSNQKHIFFTLWVILFAFNCGALSLAFMHKDKVVENLTKPTSPAEHHKNSFISVFIVVWLAIDLLLFLSIFVSGVLAYWIPKARTFGVHSVLSVASIISTLFLCYVHQIYLLIFFLRILYYVYVRYVISILHTVLLMPAYNQEDGR